MVSSRRKGEAVDGFLKQTSDFPRGPAVGPDLGRSHLAVAVDAREMPESIPLEAPGLHYPAPDPGTFPFGLRPRQLPKSHATDRDVEVDPIQQRAGHSRAVSSNHAWITAASIRTVAEEAARTGVHRGHQSDLSREPQGHSGTGDHDLTVFEGLPKRVQDVSAVLRELVQEKDTVVSEAYLSGPRDPAAAHQTRIRDGVVRGSEGSGPDEGLSRREHPGRRVDPRDLDGLFQGRRGEDSW